MDSRLRFFALGGLSFAVYHTWLTDAKKNCRQERWEFSPVTRLAAIACLRTVHVDNGEFRYLMTLCRGQLIDIYFFGQKRGISVFETVFDRKDERYNRAS